jgi:hypothetical protein
MKRTYFYRWRIHIDGPADTLERLTFEGFKREFPNDCVDPTPIEITQRTRQDPESPGEEAQMWAAWYRSLEPEDRWSPRESCEAVLSGQAVTRYSWCGRCFERSALR